MQTECIYCSARDQNVQVVITDIPSRDGHATLPDAELICLEIGTQCTGAMCPLGAESAEVMASRLAHSGLALGQLATVHARCTGCDRVTDLVVLPRNVVTCTECGATTRWKELKAE